MSGNRLGLSQGTALYIGAVLGPGVLALPALAAAAAGPASVLAWAALLAASVPIAVCFAALGARFPDGGGVSTFTARAFGARAAACVGWWFYAAVPVGVLAGALVGGQYVAGALGMGRGASLLVAVLILGGAFAANSVGLQLSGRLQLVLGAMLVALLVVVTATAAPQLRADNFRPFLAHGWSGVGSAAVVLFYAFSGWEAASHLSAEFASPRRHLMAATVLTLTVVGALYLALSTVTVGVLGAAAGSSQMPLTLLLERGGVGSAARPLTAVAAVCLSFGAVNTFIAGAARLGAALGRDGALPGWLGKGNRAGQVPRRSLAVQAVLTAGAASVVAGLGITLEPLMRVTSVLLAAVTVAGMASALALLPRRRPLWWAALAATGFAVLVLLCSAWLIILPVALAGVRH